MEQNGDEPYTETDEVRAGSTPHIVRWVLLFGTLLAIILLSATWMIGAATVNEDEDRYQEIISDDDQVVTERADPQGAKQPRATVPPTPAAT
jgi:hypothetical protein